MNSSASTPAVVALLQAGVHFESLHYEHSSDFDGAFGEEATLKLGLDPQQVFKTLMVDVDSTACCVVLPVSQRMSLKKVARAFGGKRAEMLQAHTAQRRTGYVVGGISPFGQKQPARTVIDQSCLDHETLVVSGGRRGFSLRLATVDFIKASNAEVADVVASL